MYITKILGLILKIKILHDDNEKSAMGILADTFRKMPDEIKNKFKPSKEARELYPESDWFIESWKPTAKPWYIIQDRAYEKGYIRDAIIGNAKCMLVDVKNTIELYRSALQNEPYKIYGLT